MRRAVAALAGIVASCLLAPWALMASETITYTYDELGRLVTVSSTGDVNNGEAVNTTYDPAGNRTSQAVTGTGVTQAQLSIGNASVTEGGQLSFTVTRTGNTTSAVSASYASASGSATSGADFTAVAGTVNFAANDTSETITVNTTDDGSVESAETLTVTLSNPSNATIGTAAGTGTINDNDAAELAISNASVTEGGQLVFTVTRSGNTASAVGVSYASANGTASSSSDYTAVSGTVNFVANDTSETITVNTTNDSSPESNETLTVTLSSPTGGATIIDNSGTGTINDNDLPTASVSDASVTEGGNLVFTITMTPAAQSSLRIEYVTSNGTATAGPDYDAEDDDVSFTTGVTSRTVTIDTDQDSLTEGNETMNLTISLRASDAGEAAIGDNLGVGTIVDDDVPMANLAINDVSVTEGGQLSFTVTRSGVTTSAVSVNYATSNGTASSSSDYTSASGTLNFAANDTSETITVNTTDDSTQEANETLTVTLSSPSSGAAITDGSGAGTITDNDTPANLAIGNASVTEGGQLSFTVTRSGTTTTAVTASYASANGTASSSSDYTAVSGTVSFAANDTSETITVNTTNDSTQESNETLTVTLSNPSSGAAITTAVGTGTINDNDTPPADLAIGNASVTEGGQLSFTVTRSGTTTNAVSASYASANGTASSGSDYTAVSGTVNFVANDTSETITVNTTDDSNQESSETLTVTLSNPSNGAAITTAAGTGTIDDNDGYIVLSTAGAPDHLVIVAPHTGAYSCAQGGFGGGTYNKCITASLKTVYSYQTGQNTYIAPGHSINSQNELQVQPAYYGIAP